MLGNSFFPRKAQNEKLIISPLRFKEVKFLYLFSFGLNSILLFTDLIISGNSINK